MELYGYDEERGLSETILEKGTKIEIAIEDELGAITWIRSEYHLFRRDPSSFRPASEAAE